MEKTKLQLTDSLREFLINNKKKCNLTSAELSEALGKSKFWFGNIETKKVKKISEDDLRALLSFLTGSAPDDLLEFLQDLHQKHSELPASPWLESGYIAPEFQSCSPETLNKQFESVGKRLGDLLFHHENMSVTEKRIFLTALSSLCDNLEYDLDTTTLLFGTPISALRYAKPEDFIKIKRDLHSLYDSCQQVRLESESRITRDKEINELQRKHIVFLKADIRLMVSKIPTLKQTSPEYGKICLEFFQNKYEALKEFTNIPTSAELSTPESLYDYLCECVRLCKDLCYKYDIDSSDIPAIPSDIESQLKSISTTSDNTESRHF